MATHSLRTTALRICKLKLPLVAMYLWLRQLRAGHKTQLLERHFRTVDSNTDQFDFEDEEHIIGESGLMLQDNDTEYEGI